MRSLWDLKAKNTVAPFTTLRKPHDYSATKQVEFVVMTGMNKHGEYFTGSKIKEESHHKDAFSGKPAATGIYKDSEGRWISAATPIKDKKGQVVAILQADRPIEFYNQQLYALAERLFVGALISIVFRQHACIVLCKSVSAPHKDTWFKQRKLWVKEIFRIALK